MTNYDDFTFGVEIEFTGAELVDVETGMQAILASTNIEVVREGYNHITRDHWKITTDATVTEHRNYSTGTGFGGELVSPVLRGHAGFAELEQVLAALNSVSGVTVDVRCGLHVHLSWDGMTTTHVKNIVQRYADYESVIDAWMSPSRRANQSRWCSSIANSGYPLRTVASHSGSLSRMAGLAGRYYKVNLQSLSRYGTVEFRQHQGTTDYIKISNWVKFLMGFCEASKTAQLGRGVDLRYRSSGKVYSAMRDQFAAIGYMMKWARGQNWDVFDADGNHISRKTISELDAMYSGRRLTQDFADWFNAIVNTDIPADHVFAGVEADVQHFLNDRTAHFASAA